MSNEVIELAGRKFDVVEHGVDEVQIAEFLKQLICQRDALLKQRDSLLSYIQSLKNTGENTREHGVYPGEGAASVTTTLEQDSNSGAKASEPPKAFDTGIEDATSYQGELELAIFPPVNAAALLQFAKSLREAFQLKILSVNGSPTKGSVISAMLSEPQPILQSLRKLPEVKRASREPDAGAQAVEALLFKNSRGKRLWITLAGGNG